MTRHRNLTEPEVEARIAETEWWRGVADSDADRDAAQADENRIYGTDYHDWFGDRSPVQVLDPADEADLIRQLRESARRILGRPA